MLPSGWIARSAAELRAMPLSATPVSEPPKLVSRDPLTLNRAAKFAVGHERAAHHDFVIGLDDDAAHRAGREAAEIPILEIRVFAAVVEVAHQIEAVAGGEGVRSRLSIRFLTPGRLGRLCPASSARTSWIETLGPPYRDASFGTSGAPGWCATCRKKSR